MKKLILLLVIISSSILPVSAQVGLILDRQALETDQPGVILVTTGETSQETSVQFTQIFHCIEFQGTQCREFGSDISAHQVTFRFQNQPIKESELFSFHVLYDEHNDKFVFKFYSYSDASFEYDIKEAGERTLILIKN